MERRGSSQDDFLDVIEATKKMEEYFFSVLNETDLHIALSALINTIIKCSLSQCENITDAYFFRDLFLKSIDKIIVKTNFLESR